MMTRESLWRYAPLAEDSTDRSVLVVSGGLDSVTMAYAFAKAHPTEVLALITFDYAQRHAKEVECARKCAANLGKDYRVRHKVIDLRSVGRLLMGSALTDQSIEVPKGHYTDEIMRSTVVPNRNAIMLSIAVGWAVAIEARQVLTAVHAGDHPIYPDCREEFIASFDEAMRLATNGFVNTDFAVWGPFLDKTKADIVSVGHDIEVPFKETWSCYRGKLFHCGSCATCVERREAFILAGVEDPTRYLETPEFEIEERETG